MDKKLLLKMHKWAIKNREREKMVFYISKLTPYLIFLIYIVFIIMMFLKKDVKTINFILVPAYTLVIVTIIRDVINRPRPYQTLHIEPIFTHKNGHSFPSRHTASAFVIASSILYINIYVGIIMFIFAFVMGLSRIMAGVHYPSDVFFGMILGIIGGIVLFIL